MSMEINGNYNRSQANYAEQLKEKQSLARAEKAEEAKREQKAEKVSDKISGSHDEYISSGKSGKKPSGLYRVGKDENGNPKVFFEDPKNAGDADGKEPPKVNADNSGKPAEKCTGNTDMVDREIKRLKEKKQQLEQQIQSAAGDEQKVKELERKLQQVEGELSQKDNDAYRRQHTFFY